MSYPHLSLAKAALLGVLYVCGVAAILASGGPVPPPPPQEVSRCNGEEPTENTTAFLTYASYPNGCWLSTYWLVADSQDEANQCIIDEGYLAEAASQAEPCDFFFKVRQGVACRVEHVQATNETNAVNCANYRFSGTIDNVTAAVSSGSCQRTVNESSVLAQCPSP